MNRNIIKDRIMYRGRIATVHKVTLKTSDGNTIDRDLIHYNGAVVILPVLEDGSMVFIRNYRFAVDQSLYELPAGMLEEGENPLKAARRELAEETGCKARKIQKLGKFYAAPGSSDELLHSYLATGLTQGKQQLERYEDITVKILDEKKVRQMIANGKIRDAKTIATLCLYWLREGRGDCK